MRKIFHRKESKTCHFKFASEAHSSFKGCAVAHSVKLLFYFKSCHCTKVNNYAYFISKPRSKLYLLP